MSISRDAPGLPAPVARRTERHGVALAEQIHRQIARADMAQHRGVSVHASNAARFARIAPSPSAAPSKSSKASAACAGGRRHAGLDRRHAILFGCSPVLEAQAMQRPIRRCRPARRDPEPAQSWVPAFAGITVKAPGRRGMVSPAAHRPRERGDRVAYSSESDTSRGAKPAGHRPPGRQVPRHGGTLHRTSRQARTEAGCSTKEKDQRGRSPHLPVAHRPFAGNTASRPAVHPQANRRP